MTAEDEWLTKKCAKCKVTKLRLEFEPSARSADGLRAHCDACRAAAAHIRPPACKYCPGCDERRPASQFHTNRAMPDGLHTACKVCAAERQRARNARPEVQAAARARMLRSRYDISMDEYARLLGLQEGRCAICRNRPGRRRLAVDHNHRTGAVRGLLCDWCNRRLLGGARDKVEILEAGATYLRCPPAERFDWRDKE